MVCKLYDALRNDHASARSESAPRLKQAGFAVLIVMCLLVFSLYSGRQSARLNAGKGVPGRILVSADAIDGLKKLGISFDGQISNGSSAQLSETVEILSTRGSGYLVRGKNGIIVLVKRDNVIAITESGPH